jgi:rhombotail lipoprotein
MVRHSIALASARRLLVLLVLAVQGLGCGSSLPATRTTNSALGFLYPEGLAAARPAAAVELRLPLRVGIGFAPGGREPGGAYGWRGQLDPITEEQKQRLLRQVAAAFREHEAVGHLEVIPSAYLLPEGGFANLDQLRASLGLDLMALLSYDQAQFTEATRASWTYLTIVGALVVEGEKNDTRTVMDAVVYDIRSRALLFRAAGESTVKGRSGPFTVERKRREQAAEGFARATPALIANLRAALDEFDRQARTGTVQGAGTPAIAMYDRQGERLTTANAGAGAFGLAELAAAVVLLLALLAAPHRPGAKR